MEIVEIVARQMLARGQHPSVTMEDLVSEGYLALVEIEHAGLDVLDERGYAYVAVRNAMARLLKKESLYRSRFGSDIDDRL